MRKIKILLVVDYQKDFVIGTLGFEKAVLLDKKIAQRIKEAKEAGYIIIFTMDTHYANYLKTQEGKKLPVVHCIYGEDGWQLFGETGNVIETPQYVIKNTFGAIGLIPILSAYEGDDFEVEIELCGVVTNMCVISNAVMSKTILPEANIIINAPLCASFNDELHEQALNVMESLQMTVIGRE